MDQQSHETSRVSGWGVKSYRTYPVSAGSGLEELAPLMYSIDDVGEEGAQRLVDDILQVCHRLLLVRACARACVFRNAHGKDIENIVGEGVREGMKEGERERQQGTGGGGGRGRPAKGATESARRALARSGS